MKIIPAIDLKDNKCVRLSKGEESSSKIFNKNPIKQAKIFEEDGCERIHIIDLDAAFGRPGINKKTILDIRQSTNLEIELGGGIRTKEDIVFWLEKKIDYLIIGSFASNESSKLKLIADEYENKIYISLDLLDDAIMIRGWKENSKIKIDNLVKIFNNSKIKGYILTDISRDGMMEGINLNLVKKNLLLTHKPMIVGGGLSNYEDLINLKNLNSKNLEGVIAGKSYYFNKIQIKKSIKILNEQA